MGVRTMLTQRVTLCLAALLLILDRCGAFVVPTTFGTRAKFEDHHSVLRSPPRGESLKMALSGLPSKSPRRKRPWEDDLVTTIGKAAFSSFKDKARDMMVKGAEKRGLDWTGVVNNLKEAQNWEKLREGILTNTDVVVPDYYFKQFHAYGEGNLCWQAAFEQEVASLAVGIRSFPKEGLNADNLLRQTFITQLIRLGGQVEDGGNIVDFGCGVGTSTRVLAEGMLHARRVIGMDLSPYMLAVGKHYNEERKMGKRVSLLYGDVADTRLPTGTASLVSCTYLLHEMPEEAVRDVLAEAFRLLKPGGSLAITDMDPDAPGYKKLRSNPLLFSVVRSTEPYLDQWFDVAPRIHHILAETGFSVIRKGAVTGRHFLVVATKAGSLDLRPSDDARASMDEHLKTWET